MHLYYSLFYGLGTSSSCSTSNDNVCISWSDTKAWDTFIRLLVPLVNLVMAPSGSAIESTLIMTQVFLPIASFSCLLSAVCLGYSLQKTLTVTQTNKIVLHSISCVFTTLAWVLGLVSFECILSLTVTQGYVWKVFYSGIAVYYCYFSRYKRIIYIYYIDGYNLINLIDGVDTQGQKPVSGECTVSVSFIGNNNIRIFKVSLFTYTVCCCLYQVLLLL